MSTPVRRANRTYRCARCGFSATYPDAGAKQARTWFDKHSCRKHEEAMVREHLADLRWQAVDRTPKPCHHKQANHVHGTRACYVLDRCRCTPCSEANTEAENERTRLKAYGRYTKYVDAYPVRLHIRELMDFGIGLKQIVKVSGVSQGTLWKLMYGKPDANGNRTPSRRVLRETAEKVYAIEPLLEHLADGALVDQTGTARRIQALVAIGYSASVLGQRLGVGRANFTPILHGRRRVTKGLALRVRDLYDELSMTPAEGHEQRTRISVSRSRNLARANAWTPPLAWDDETIDDPAAAPDIGEPMAQADVDEIAVQRFIDGDLDKSALTQADRLEIVRQWRQLGRPLAELERRGLKPDRYLNLSA